MFYRPDDGDEPSLRHLGTSLQRATHIQNSLLLIGGNFNFPDWGWITTTLKPKSSYPRLHLDLLNMLNDNGLEQLVKDPTRGVNTLDLFLTNWSPELKSYQASPTTAYHIVRSAPLLGKRSRHSADYPCMPRQTGMALGQLLQTGVQIYETNATRKQQRGCGKNSDSLLSAIKKLIPYKTARTKANQPWTTPGIRQLINSQDRKYRKMKKAGSAELREEVKVLWRTIQRQISQSYWKCLKSVFTEEENAHQAGNKRFWSYIKDQP